PPDEVRAPIVMQRGREHLSRRGRAAVDHDDQLRAVRDVPGCGVHTEVRLIGAPAGADDGAGVEKIVGHTDRRVEHTAWIVAQVDDEALERMWRAMLQMR